jgi:hypothetical protein
VLLLSIDSSPTHTDSPKEMDFLDSMQYIM